MIHDAVETVAAGASAVNPRGEVMLFVEVDPQLFTEFSVSGHTIHLSGRGADPHARKYGDIAVAAARKTNSVRVMQLDSRGEPVATVTVRRSKPD